MQHTILFLPGLLCDAALWRAQTQALSAHATCVVADMTQDDSISGMVSRALTDMPDTFSVVGLSMGGYGALEVMRQAGARVRRLVLMDTSARADDAKRIQRRKNLIKRVERGAFEAVIEEHFPSFVHPSRLTDAPLMATIRASAHAVGPDAYIREQTAIMNRPDSLGLLGDIGCPTLVMCGAEDALTVPALHREMTDGIPGATLQMIDGSGHLPPLEKPDAVTAALHAWLIKDA